MKKKHTAQIRKLYDRAGKTHNELVAIFNKKSLTTGDKTDLNTVLGLHTKFLVACGKLIGVVE